MKKILWSLFLASTWTLLCRAQAPTETILSNCENVVGYCDGFQNGNAWVSISTHEGIGTAANVGGHNFGGVMYYDKNQPLSSTNPKVLVDFSGAGDAISEPLSNLVADGSGNYYGTSVGNTYFANGGTVYELSNVSSSGATVAIINPNLQLGGNRANPEGQAVLDSCFGFSGASPVNECLYFTSGNGGTNGYGVLVAVELTGSNVGTAHDLFDNFTETSTVGSFGCAPEGGLAEQVIDYAPGIQLFGTSSGCGQYSDGTLWKAILGTSNTTVALLHVFGSITLDGFNPEGPVLPIIYSGHHHLYGTTVGGGMGIGGGSWASGTFYDYDLNASTYTIQYNFKGYGNDDGGQPEGALFQDGLTGIEGITYNGDGPGCQCGNNGTVYVLTPGSPWTETIVYTFGASSSDATHPTDVQSVNNQVIGFTLSGGTYNNGTIFQIINNP